MAGPSAWASPDPPAPATVPATRPSTPTSGRPADDEIALARGVFRLERGDAAGAAEALADLAARFPGDADVRAVNDLARARALAEQDRRLRVSLSAGYEYVSRLIILDRPIGPPDSNTQFQGAVVDGHATLALYRDDALEVGVQTTDFYTGIFETDRQLSDFDDAEFVASFQGGPYVDVLLGRNDHLSLSYDAQYVLIPPGAIWGATRQAATAGLAHVEPRFGVTALTGQYAVESFSNFFNTERNLSFGGDVAKVYATGGVKLAVGASHTFRLPKQYAGNHPGADVEVAVGYEKQLAIQPEFRAEFVTVSVVLRAPLPVNDGLTIDAGVRFVYGDFDRKRFLSDEGRIGRRFDSEVGLSGGLTQSLGPNAAIRFECDYLRHGSNIIASSGQAYDYDRYVVGVRLLFDF